MYIVTPKDILLVRARDLDDKVAWALERKEYHMAIEYITSDPGQLQRTPREDVVNLYLGHLFTLEQYNQAGLECKKLLDESTELWEAWIWAFSQKNQLGAIAPYIPTSNPRLNPKLVSFFKKKGDIYDMM